MLEVYTKRVRDNISDSQDGKHETHQKVLRSDYSFT